jgi:hypothetical protein
VGSSFTTSLVHHHEASNLQLGTIDPLAPCKTLTAATLCCHKFVKVRVRAASLINTHFSIPQSPSPAASATAITSSKMQYPDENLPKYEMNLKQFVTSAQILSTAGEQENFALLLYAGRMEVDGVKKRVYVNPRQGASAPPAGLYDIRRDIDSAIGVTKNLPFKSPLAVFPMSSFEDTLKKTNHLTRWIARPAVGDVDWSLE